jgi:isochorismate hydrolase
LHDESPFSRIIPEFAAKPGFKVMRKTQYDAFYGTDLERRLKAAGAKSIVVCGVMTDLCCETTARSAFVRGFDILFCADGTATTSEQLHVSALRTLAHGFAEITTCGELAAALEDGACKKHKAAENTEALR